jgi:hypothetical protein
MNRNQTSSHNSTGNNPNNTNDKPFKVLILNVEDNKNTQDELKKYKINKNDIHVKFTANNNLMIHLKNIEDLNKIIDDNNTFDDKKKINLEADDNNQVDIVIKSLSYTKAEEYIELLKKNGITKIVDFKSSRITGAKCTNHNARQILVNNGIILGYTFHKVEIYAKPVHVMQCLNCFEFNHKASQCANNIKCKNCGENHSADDCISTMTKCCNCGESHKATFKQCKQYAEKAQEKINKIKDKKTKSQVVRIYSETVSNSQSHTNNEINNNPILKAIAELKTSNANYEKNINEKFEQLLTKEASNGDKITELEKNLTTKIDQIRDEIKTDYKAEIQQVEISLNDKKS